MVECARLESEYTFTGIEGSNPSLSALIGNKARGLIFLVNYGYFMVKFTKYDIISGDADIG